MKLAKISVDKTMSSLEIAELTGKEHKNVLADIRAMFKELGIEGAKFSAPLKMKSGQTAKVFNLNEELTLTLVSGYSTTLRNKIIKRWQELETQEQTRINAAAEWQVSRLESKTEYKRLCQAVQQHRELEGKLTDARHYMCEAKLVWYAFTGEFKKIEREGLTAGELGILSNIETMAFALIAQGLEYAESKSILRIYGLKQRQLELVNIAKKELGL